MKGICKLCQSEKELRRSHIIPEFMYQNIYDTDPKRFYTLDIDVEELNRSTSRIQQKGIREYLLCDKCEGQLSKYEAYAAETIYSKNLGNKTHIVESSITADRQHFLYDYEGFSYKEFKLLTLSILWRLLVSKSFSIPKIPSEITERLRTALVNENPLDFDDFGCLLQVIFYKEGLIAGKFILQPYLTGTKNNIINILIDGFMYSFYLNSKDCTDEQKQVFVKPDGTMKIIGRIIFNDEGLMRKAQAINNYYIDSLHER